MDQWTTAEESVTSENRSPFGVLRPDKMQKNVHKQEGRRKEVNESGSNNKSLGWKEPKKLQIKDR